MMRLGVATKGQSLLQALEVPSIAAPIRDEAEEEPPSSSASSMRSRFFGHVSRRTGAIGSGSFGIVSQQLTN